jgi:hypothetical protein
MENPQLVEGTKAQMTGANEAAVALMRRPEPTEADAKGIDPERRAFLDAAFRRHLGPEIRADLAGIVASYATGGHLNFNGAIYETPEDLFRFHREMGFDGQGVLAGLGAEITRMNYTYDSVIVEYMMQGTITAKLRGAEAGRRATFPSCGVYQFNDDGELVSERIYLDTGNWLVAPIFRP